LQHANLADAKLQGANLNAADLKVANLVRADLEGADLRGTNSLIISCNFVKGAQFDTRATDPWWVLRRTYSGPRLIFNLLFLAAFLSPYIVKVLFWVAINRTQAFTAAVVGDQAGMLIPEAGTARRRRRSIEKPTDRRVRSVAVCPGLVLRVSGLFLERGTCLVANGPVALLLDHLVLDVVGVDNVSHDFFRFIGWEPIVAWSGAVE
jgi:hypothetical protein